MRRSAASHCGSAPIAQRITIGSENEQAMPWIVPLFSVMS